ncbi:keratinocyte-associated protein 3-like [Sinocyclocheilus rhinocerous]|uniref:Keratinocyte-associated protein 3-like n=1 Tax=Sinocyclocheilus rhinocerous TaxID=307959 RepID=A0A673KL80_9TELE|nr:PREDICTED: keratinocyte-associated protein 3-like [Sinocyclocheilus rhinocerous]
MGNSGVCCGNLEEQKGLMKMGLSMVLVGHVNFLLGALVHGVVLRHFSLQRGQAMESAISNVIALAAGLLGVIIGILTIVLSNNRKNRVLTWSVFVSSAVAVLVAAASVIGLMVSLVKTIIHDDKRLLAYCGYSDGRSHLTIANVCPFDPTRIFSTIVLWVPLILMSAVEMVFSYRLFKVSISYLGLPWCLRKQHLQDESRLMKTPRAAEPCYSPSSRRCQEDEERKLSVIRPPERHRPPNSRPYGSVSFGQYRQHHSASPFNRAALERSSIWI